MAALHLRFVYRFMRLKSCSHVYNCSRNASTQNSKQSVREKLLRAVNSHDKKSNEILLRPLRLNSVHFGTSFSEGGVDCRLHSHDGEGKLWNPSEPSHSRTKSEVIDFRVLYEKGYDILKNYCKAGLVQEDEHLPILNSLVTFLQNIERHEKSLNSYSEWLPIDAFSRLEIYQSAIIANHLLSRLVPNGQYSLSSDNKGKVGAPLCPCSKKGCRDMIYYGDTSIGYEEMWYGKPDMIVYPCAENSAVDGPSSVFTPPETDWLDIDNEEATQILEMETPPSDVLRRLKTVRQGVTQTLTFAMYQANFQMRESKKKNFVSLIPTIAMTLNEFDIYMYDYEHDVLLRNYGGPIQLWETVGNQRMLNIGSILQIWMTIHHSFLDARLKQHHIEKLEGTSQFRYLCGDRFSDFKESVIYQPSIVSKSTLNENLIYLDPVDEIGQFGSEGDVCNV